MNLHLILKRRWFSQRRPGLISSDLRKSIRLSLFQIIALLGAHVIAMMVFENIGFWQSVWLTLVTVSTVGYGDVSASTPEGQIATIVVILVGAVMLLPKLAGDYLDYRGNIKEQKLKGKWRWNMTDHTVILNTPATDREQYLKRLIMQFRASDEYSDSSMEIVTSEFPDGLPESILNLKNVTHYHGRADDTTCLTAANVVDASSIIVLAKRESDKASDGRTFDILHRLKELGVEGRILAECVDDANRDRLIKAGADVVIRPIRAYPEMIVRAFVAPGAEEIIENMFSHSGDEYIRFDVDVEKSRWAYVTCALATNDIGTAIGYVSKSDGQLHCNPPQLEPFSASAIFVVAREENMPNIGAVKEALL